MNAVPVYSGIEVELARDQRAVADEGAAEIELALDGTPARLEGLRRDLAEDRPAR